MGSDCLMVNRVENPKHYTMTQSGTYAVSRKGTYYGTYDSEEQAKEVVQLLQENDWDPSVIPQSSRGKGSHKNLTQKHRYWDLKSQKLLNKFCDERNIRDATGKGYISTLKKYTDFNKMYIYDLIDEALKEQDAHIPLRESKLKKRLIGYRNWLLSESGMSMRSCKTYFSKMLTVYRHFECEIPMLPLAQYKQEYVTTYSDLPTLKHLRQALDISPVNLRAVLCFQVSSGSAKAEALSLTVRQFFKGTEEYYDTPYDENTGTLFRILDELDHKLESLELVVPTFYLERIKTKKFYYTFCSPEACYWIVKDLRLRIGKYDVQDFLSSQLFDFTSSLLLTRYQEINDFFNWGKKGKYRFFRAHVLRKWNASNIQMTAEDIDNIQGRSKDSVHEAYIKVKPERLKKTYMEHMWRVCIDEKWRKACIVLDKESKEEFGVTTPKERAMEKIMGMLENKLGSAVPLQGLVEPEPKVPEIPVPPVLVKPEPKPEPVPVSVPMNTNSSVNGYDKLLEYASLVKEGLISVDEFNQIKQSIFRG